jgi:hypothetical protein
MPHWGNTKMHASKKQLPIRGVCQERTTVSSIDKVLKNNVRNIPATPQTCQGGRCIGKHSANVL